MSRQTTNYGLTKPDYTDIADIEVVNSNMDIIDEALKVIDTKSNNIMSKNSSAWSSTVAYAVGQYCIYNNSLWKCLVQHSGQTPQEGTYWARVSLDTLGSEINALNSNFNNFYILNLDSGKPTSSEELIKQKVEEGKFSQKGIYLGMLNKASISSYIAMSIGQYMAFLVFGYVEANPIYLIYTKGNWTKITL